jgi:3-keto-5-aminohexanoate cleavage enzyme
LNIVKELGQGHGTRFEFECYDLGHLYNLAWLIDQGCSHGPLRDKVAAVLIGWSSATAPTGSVPDPRPGQQERAGDGGAKSTWKASDSLAWTVR